MVKYTLDQCLLARLNGWEAKQWLFMSTVGDLPFLRDCEQIEKTDKTAGLHGMSLIIICSIKNPAVAYALAEKAIQSGIQNLGIWVLEYSEIAELVSLGYRHNTPKKLSLDNQWRTAVKTISEATWK